MKYLKHLILFQSFLISGVAFICTSCLLYKDKMVFVDYNFFQLIWAFILIALFQKYFATALLILGLFLVYKARKIYKNHIEKL